MWNSTQVMVHYSKAERWKEKKMKENCLFLSAACKLKLLFEDCHTVGTDLLSIVERLSLSRRFCPESHMNHTSITLYFTNRESILNEV